MTSFAQKSKNGGAMPRKVSGWVLRQSCSSTLVRLPTGEEVFAPACHDLLFGTPVAIELCKELRHGAFCGRIVASALPAVGRHDGRPLAVIDSSNLSSFGEPVPEDMDRWKFGAVKAFALGLACDSAGWQPCFVRDPGDMDAFRRHHPPSWKALQAICRSTRWASKPPRVNLAWPRDSGDQVAISILVDDPTAVFITNDGLGNEELHSLFPQLDDFDFLGRIYAPCLRGDIISGPSLGVSAQIPAVLFC